MTVERRMRTAAVWVAAIGGYILLACSLTWPLPRHLRTHLLGGTGSDTGVYVWNLWIFRHELIDHGRLPLSTDHLFAYTGVTDFTLHNYTPLAGLLGVPLMGLLGVVGTYNAILIAFVALSGLAVFALARRLDLGSVAAWSAGALFIASPVMSARSTQHLSIITAAPLALFLWVLLRVLDTKRIRDSVLVGLMVAVATYSDAYYGIYCIVIGAFFVMWRFTRVRWRPGGTRTRMVVRVGDLLIASIVVMIAWRFLTGATSIVLGDHHIGLHTLYTPVLALFVMVSLRAWLTHPFVLMVHDPDKSLMRVMRLGFLSIGVSLVLLMPMIVGIGYSHAADRLPDLATHWRTSPAGVDLLAYFVPNPVHAWFGPTTRSWFIPSNDGFPEYVGSFSLVAFTVIGISAFLRALPRVWVTFTAVAALLSLGPFIHVAGFNTYVVGPWAVLRYVPIIGMARSPSRFVILAVLGLSILFAFAVAALSHRYPRGRRIWLPLIVVALMLELSPAPRVLHSADVPVVYQLIRTDGDETGRLLELPTGVRDGTSSLGNFNPASQFFQTGHRRQMIGGYLSRVSGWRKRESRRSPVLRAIFELSEGRALSAELLARARESSKAFLQRTCVRYVVVNKEHASSELRRFAIETLSLSLVHEDDQYQLLTPVDPPPCERRRRRGHFPRTDDTPRLTR